MPKCDYCQKEVKPEDFDEQLGLCNECAAYIMDVENENRRQRVQITRDMASDACDKSLEGQWIDW